MKTETPKFLQCQQCDLVAKAMLEAALDETRQGPRRAGGEGGEMKHPNYEIIEQTDEYVLIRDIGPWDIFPTVTNGAEEVVGELAQMLNGRRLEYYDSEGERTELLVSGGAFAGFRNVG